ncbi:DUF4136 domain-containing protein [Flavobacteriaceae bacterium AU392]|nr:DUF4136 domain-containing protein [Flavobacteriaceae bacterium]RKM86970.1 DUF4136 domain-containing protein [Flavobacteriaceae bacterium AU392]
MKRLLKIIPLAILLMVVITSCSSIRVAADYDTNASFEGYKTFAFFKTGIDNAKISDLDKRRILRAIEAELLAKGFIKSENPDILVSIFTKSRERVNVYNGGFGFGGFGFGGFGFGGFGYGYPFYGGRFGNSVTTSTEGLLYIDFIDADKKELIWQGSGSGYLTQNVAKKEERIKEFVSKIIEAYPPGIASK